MAKFTVKEDQPSFIAPALDCTPLTDYATLNERMRWNTSAKLHEFEFVCDRRSDVTGTVESGQM